MAFLTQEKESEKLSLVANGEQSFSQTLIIVLSLVYLAIPNMLFLWGWFMPCVSHAVTVLILFALGRVLFLSLPESLPWQRPTGARTLALFGGILVASLVIFGYLVGSGLLGYFTTYHDLGVIRHAMFCNLRDAAWPLVLPNGREMSYYMANMLPAAALARLAPQHGQWFIVIWVWAGLLLALLLLSSHLRAGGASWGRRLICLSLMMGIFCSPMLCSAARRVMTSAFFHLNELSGVDLSGIMPGTYVGLNTCLSYCGGCYNSFGPALLGGALLISCRIRAANVLPAAVALLFPLSPLACIGIMPLAALRCLPAMKEMRCKSALAWDALLPLGMLFVSVIYFLRADGSTVFCLMFNAENWPSFAHMYLWLMCGWIWLILPLWFVARRDAFFYGVLAMYLLIPLFYIGSVREDGAFFNNELWLKNAQPFMMIACCYWFLTWRQMGWYRYIVMGICALWMCFDLAFGAERWGCNAYLELVDRYSGHLNHDDPFLNQSVPPCTEPMLPETMFRSAGESEKCFPGSLLPHAPGCDYSRPANSEGKLTY